MSDNESKTLVNIRDPSTQSELLLDPFAFQNLKKHVLLGFAGLYRQIKLNDPSGICIYPDQRNQCYPFNLLRSLRFCLLFPSLTENLIYFDINSCKAAGDNYPNTNLLLVPRLNIKKISFQYTYATKKDWFMIFIGICGAIVTGLCTPANMLIFGDLLDVS